MRRQRNPYRPAGEPGPASFGGHRPGIAHGRYFLLPSLQAEISAATIAIVLNLILPQDPEVEPAHD